MMHLARNQKQLGNIIRRHRQKNGLTQAVLAKRTGLRQSTISMIESGDTDARIDTLFAILAALNLEFHVAQRTQTDLNDIIDDEILN
ncbi:MAG: helix-turn-helix transcriptional regulator [Rhodospirillales bacterium]